MKDKLTFQTKLTVEPRLVLTPQLRLTLKLIQMSALELEEYLSQELDSNIFLERENQDIKEDKIENNEKEIKRDELKEIEQKLNEGWENWEQERSSIEYDGEREDDGYSPINNITTTENLINHLLWQLQMDRFNKREVEIGIEIICNLNDAGFLTVKLEEISEKLKVSVEEVEEVRRRIQEFDPAGVASLDLKECFKVQLKLAGIKNNTCHRIIEECFPLMLKKDLPKISSKLGLSLEEVKESFELIINNCDPRPGKNYSSNQVDYVYPELRVVKKGDQYDVELTTDEKIPGLKISKHYVELFQKAKNDPQAARFLKENYERAKFVINSIRQRNETLLKVGKSIVKFQQEFLEKGPEYLNPLILKTVADDIGLHQSTISRVVKNKWIDTERGIYPLKYFFSSKVKGKNPYQYLSSKGVKEKIKNIIDEEDPNKPYSDEKIANILDMRYGIKVARRTVAKYRESMGILNACQRKRQKMI